MNPLLSSGPCVQVRDLSYTYPAKGKKSPARQALESVTFETLQGELFGILGPNGSGKSTLFRILSTAVRPRAGSVVVLGADAARDPAAVRRRLGVVFQSPALDQKLSALENLLCQGRLYGMGGEALKKKADSLLERFGLKDRGGAEVQTLSGGMRRKVELAKALLHDPELLILDEPTTGVDPGARLEFWSWLSEIRQGRGIGILVTTHLMDEAERMDRIAILDKGKIVALGEPAKMRSEIGGDVIALESDEPHKLADAIRERFRIEVFAVDGGLRLEEASGHLLIPRLIEAFPGLIRSVNLAKPGLEDVFIHKTGHRFQR